MQAHSLISWSSLKPLQPAYALAANVDLMVLRLEDDDAEQVVVMYGRCQHRGALMADAHIQGDKIVCGLHGSHYIYKTGINPRYINKNLKHGLKIIMSVLISKKLQHGKEKTAGI